MASVFKRGGKAAKGGVWYAAWVDSAGKQQAKSTRTTDRSAAERIAAKYEADAALRRDGVIDGYAEGVAAQSRRTIASHLEDFVAKLQAANDGKRHINATRNQIRNLCDFAGFKTAADINADGVNRFAKHLREQGNGSSSIHHHLTAIKSFTKWLATEGKLPRNPLMSVIRPNPKADRRYERRMVLPAEWHYLRSHIAGENSGLSADERVLLYETAIQTGLRSSELRSLTPGKLHLAGDKPYVVCKAGCTKNDDLARQYILPDLAAKLKQHVARERRSTVFRMPTDTLVARMLQSDLMAARLAWVNEAKGNKEETARRNASDFLAVTNHDGEIADFHSLRHTCGAWLAMAGAHPKAIQSVMRHGTIVLTMDTYGHLFPGQEAETIQRFSTILSAVNAQRIGGDCGPHESATGDCRRLAKSDCQDHKSFDAATLCGCCQAVADAGDMRQDVQSGAVVDDYISVAGSIYLSRNPACTSIATIHAGGIARPTRLSVAGRRRPICPQGRINRRHCCRPGRLGQCSGRLATAPTS